MGIALVLLSYLVLGLCICCFAAFVSHVVATKLTLLLPLVRVRTEAIKWVTIFPFFAMAWIISLFLIQAVINDGLLKRDCCLGDTLYCPILNEYEILMIDGTDHGSVFKLEKNLLDSANSAKSINGVRLLQVADKYLLIASDSRFFDHIGKNESKVDTFYIVDTSSGSRKQLNSESQLLRAASAIGLSLKLEPILTVYMRYRFTLLDRTIVFLIFSIPCAGFCFVWFRYLRLCRKCK